MQENINEYLLDENGNPITETIDEIGLMHINKSKSKKNWYKTESARDYITGKSDDILSGKGARSLERARQNYQHLSEDFSKHQYSSKFMSRKYDKFNGIDLEVIDLARREADEKYNLAKTQYENGEINDRQFEKFEKNYEKTLRNLEANYQSLYEVWHNKHDIPLVRTQSSVSSLPFLAGTIGLPAAIIGAAETLPWLFTTSGIQNKFAKDILVGTTANLIGDQLIREVTPYNGIADGLVKQGAKAYYNLKYNGNDKQKAYNKFISKEHPWLTFGAEFFNPTNWLNPAAIASKFGLSRNFDRFGNELTNNFQIDLKTVFDRSKKLGKSKNIEVENVDPKDIFKLFEDNKHLTSISDTYHGANYVRNIDGIHIIDQNGSLIKINNPNEIGVIPKIEFTKETEDQLTSIIDDLEKNNKIVLAGNLIDIRHGLNSPQPMMRGQMPFKGEIFYAPESYKNSILKDIDNQIKLIEQEEFNGKEITLPSLRELREQFVSDPLIYGGYTAAEKPGKFAIEDLHDNSVTLVTYLPNGKDFIKYNDGKVQSMRMYNTKLPIPIKRVYSNGIEETYFDGIRTTFDGNISTHKRYLTGLESDGITIQGDFEPSLLERNLAHTIDDPNSSNLVDVNGNVNIFAYNNLKKKLAEILGKSEKEIDNIFSSGEYRTDGVKSLDDHLLQVARSAQELPLPQGYSRQEAVTAALLHDLGKVINSDKILHGYSSIDLINQLNIPELNNPKIRNAIKHHMESPEMNLFGMEGNTNFKGDEIDTNFASFLHLADVARGASLEDTQFYFPHLFSYNYPKGTVLKGDPIEQMQDLNRILTVMGYDGIDTSLPINDQWKQLQSNMRRANTFIRGSRIYYNPNDQANHVRNYKNAQYLAGQRGLDPNNLKDVWTIAQENIPMEPTGSGRLNLFDTDNFIHTIKKHTWGDAAAISPEKMDGLYISVSPETGNTYQQASNDYAYSGQSTILRGNLSDYDIQENESPFEYFERLYPFIHRPNTTSSYSAPINPLSEENHIVANILLGRVGNLDRSASINILRQYFPQSDFMRVMDAIKNKKFSAETVANTIQKIPQSTVDLYKKYGFSKLDVVLNNLVANTAQEPHSVVYLPHYRQNIILGTYGTIYPLGSNNIGENFQAVVVGPKGQKIFTVLDELDVNGYPKSSSGAFRDAGGYNIREGLKINIPFYKKGSKLNKQK